MDSEQSLDECGCAPSAHERKKLWPAVTRRNALTLGAIGVVTFGAIGAVGAPFIPAAFAAGYPSWDDVQRAKNNEAAKAAEVSRIEALIQGLADDLAAKQQAAKEASDAFYLAQNAYNEAVHRADDLQAAADAEATKAQDAAAKAGRVAAQLYRDGGDDTSLKLFFAGSAATADDLLARLGTMDKLLERNQDVYNEAITARDSAQSLSDQASVARDERDRLQKEAEAKMAAAQTAAEAAQAALDAQNSHKVELEAQLASLKDTTAKTVADYQAGVEAARKAEEARKQKEREEAERLAQQQGGGSVGAGGWVRPTGGSQSSGYGQRYVQCGPSYCASGFHEGVDLAPGCSAAIYAAQSGTVTYAGGNGGYGNYIRIDHGGGVGTGYAHIRDGGIFVGRGQWVNAGQLIASVGNTGNSFGCHLHYEVYVNGRTVDPVPFMAARGISV